MPTQPTIESLKEEREKIIQEERILDIANPTLRKLEKALNNKDNIAIALGGIVMTLAVYIWEYFYYDNFSWGRFWGTALVCLYPGCIVWVGLGMFLIHPFVEWLIHLYYDISSKKYEEFKAFRSSLTSKKNSLNIEIARQERAAKREKDKEREVSLIQNLKGLIENLLNNRISRSLAVGLKTELEEEHSKIKSDGYQIEKSITYTNFFKKIEKLINPSVPDQRFFRNTNNNPIESKRINDFTHKSNETAEDKAMLEEIKILGSLPPANNPANPNIATSAVALNKPKPTPKEEEKTITELFGEPKETIRDETTRSYQPKPQLKINFPKLNEHRHNIGELGELFILQREQDYLISKGWIRQSADIVHISCKSDSEGYDILSFTESGERKHIEVKTTTGNQYEPFYLSRQEMHVMKRLKHYWIYRVFNFNVDLRKGDFYKIDCSKGLDGYYDIDASSFKISPKL